MRDPVLSAECNFIWNSELAINELKPQKILITFLKNKMSIHFY